MQKSGSHIKISKRIMCLSFILFIVSTVLFMDCHTNIAMDSMRTPQTESLAKLAHITTINSEICMLEESGNRIASTGHSVIGTKTSENSFIKRLEGICLVSLGLLASYHILLIRKYQILFNTGYISFILIYIHDMDGKKRLTF